MWNPLFRPEADLISVARACVCVCVCVRVRVSFVKSRRLRLALISLFMYLNRWNFHMKNMKQGVTLILEWIRWAN